ncbi:sigma-70 family RNA polymerase sigma factor [Blastopirellula sp. JC732]|uniref:Sigma-70 family RNA polymerase sigma factor n=1 Tax=Blastopirellula sediminis TaxID=2894196 RepID=A0A9X1SF95_9BACT|nr:sigma-70 family RNA polymerase sigma factor [Blastopirellula sediminis]MCC9608308.1 sigma-70 family RNA polymerase sigma factor [Blastopirellula sediminis]MCC9628915.1 sigma-70 family RNA polymerase sigma factor [Blastopirellula sediminis]
MSERTELIENRIQKLKRGDSEARNELLQLAEDRLVAMTRKIKRDFPDLGRWIDTNDVFQQAAIRLLRSLDAVELNDARHFFRLAAQKIRFELIDLMRKFYGPEGMGRKHQSAARRLQDSEGAHANLADDQAAIDDPRDMDELRMDLFEAVDSLPADEREVVDLLMFHNLTQEEAAQVIGKSVRSIRRYWRSALFLLHEKLEPGD